MLGETLLGIGGGWNWTLITQMVTALAGSVAAIAGSLGAAAAWRAAKASQRTSQDAMRALAIGIEPRLSIEAPRWGEPEQDEVLVENRSEWDPCRSSPRLRHARGRTPTTPVWALTMP